MGRQCLRRRSPAVSLLGQQNIVGKQIVSDSGFEWTEDALERMKKVPFFVRRAAKSKIEKAAKELGETNITAELVDRVRDSEMAKRNKK